MTVDWFRMLFDTNGFPTRQLGSPLPETFTSIYVVTNALMACSLLLVAACILFIWKCRRPEPQYDWPNPCFAAFIASCAGLHVCDLLAFSWPAYRLFAFINAIAAILSIVTAIWLPSLIRVMLSIPSQRQFRQINVELERAVALKDEAINDSKRTITALRRQIDHLERMRQTGLWVAEQESALRELKSVLDSASVTVAPQ